MDAENGAPSPSSSLSSCRSCSLLVFGMIDFGLAINRYTVLNNATREGVRAASLGAERRARSRASVTDSLSDLRLAALHGHRRVQEA